MFDKPSNSSATIKQPPATLFGQSAPASKRSPVHLRACQCHDDNPRQSRARRSGFQEEGHEGKPFHILIACLWVLEEASFESCMPYSRLLAKHRGTHPARSHTACLS